jgi:hypothetical protein
MKGYYLAAAAAVAMCAPAEAATVTLTFDPGTYQLIDDDGLISVYLVNGYTLTGTGLVADGAYTTRVGPQGQSGFSFSNLPLPWVVQSIDLKGPGTVGYQVASGYVDVVLGSTFSTYFPGAVTSGLNMSARGTGVAFSVDNIVVNLGGAVPEPATWALMLAGFGMAGAAARRRKPALA